MRALVCGNPDLYNGISFFPKCQADGLQLPLIHLSFTIVLNRTTQYSSRAGTAFQAVSDAIRRVAVRFREELPTFFTGGDIRSADIPDHHSVAVVSCHTGKPLSALTPVSYTVQDSTPQIRADPLQGSDRAA